MQERDISQEDEDELQKKHGEIVGYKWFESDDTTEFSKYDVIDVEGCWCKRFSGETIYREPYAVRSLVEMIKVVEEVFPVVGYTDKHAGIWTVEKLRYETR